MKIRRGTVSKRVVDGKDKTIVDGVVLLDDGAAHIDVFRAPEWARGIFAGVSSGSHRISHGVATLDIDPGEFVKYWKKTDRSEDDSLFVTDDLSLLYSLADEMGWQRFMLNAPCFLTDFSASGMVFTCPGGDVRIVSESESEYVFPPMSAVAYEINGDEYTVSRGWGAAISSILGNEPLLIFDDNDETEPLPRSVNLEMGAPVRGVVPAWK